jgi:hypothetical protein
MSDRFDAKAAWKRFVVLVPAISSFVPVATSVSVSTTSLFVSVAIGGIPAYEKSGPSGTKQSQHKRDRKLAVHERVRRHQPPSNGRRKHWWPEGAICHEGRNAEAKQYKGNCLCQHGYAPNKRAAAAQRTISSRCRRPIASDGSRLFIRGNSRRTTPSSSAARILPEMLRQHGNCEVTNKTAASDSYFW